MSGPERIDELKKLWLLDKVVENGGFQKAALQAKVTRSAVSQTISHLEKAHGKILLVRERGSVRPTPYCLEILRVARPILKSLDSLEPASDAGEIPRMSWLDLGAYDSLAIQIMPRLIARLEAKCPGCRVTVKVARSGKLATMVRRGELCVAIVIENDLNRGLTVIPLAEDRLGVYVSAKLAPEKREWERVREMNLGAISPGPDGVPRYFAKFTKESDLTKHPSFTSDSLEALMEAAAFGSIAAILPHRVAHRRKEDLIEVTPERLIEKGAGSHRICLVSRTNCDAKENDFLAREIKRLL